MSYDSCFVDCSSVAAEVLDPVAGDPVERRRVPARSSNHRMPSWKRTGAIPGAVIGYIMFRQMPRSIACDFEHSELNPMDDTNSLMLQAADLGAKGSISRQAG